MSDQFEIIHKPPFTEELCEDLARLTVQLSSRFDGRTPEFDQKLKAVIEHPAAHLFLAVRKSDQKTLGCVMFTEVYTPLESYAFIDHVVVDEEARGQGLGRQMLDAVEAKAQEIGLDRLHAFARPQRVAAHALYKSFGFLPKETMFLYKQLPK